MSSHPMLYLSLNGIPTKKPSEEVSVYFYRNPQGAWHPNSGSHLHEIDHVCVEIHDAFAARIFGNIETYYAALPNSPEFLATAGMNSESPISKDQFAQLLSSLPDQPQANQALYLYDCRKLVSSIQECSKEVMQLQGEFYQTLNLEELFFPAAPEDDGVRYVTSPTVIKLFALLGFFYIRLHSLLDYITKLAIEVESRRDTFENYPQLASKNSLFSDRSKISWNGKPGTLFERCPFITEIETIRNHLIHDGFLDDLPKAYRVISNGDCIEKFVLFPDRGEEGRFEAFKNRSLFYGKEDKINLRLPAVTSEFQVRLLKTLGLLKQILGEAQGP
jgi:hypothetical protein